MKISQTPKNGETDSVVVPFVIPPERKTAAKLAAVKAAVANVDVSLQSDAEIVTMLLGEGWSITPYKDDKWKSMEELAHLQICQNNIPQGEIIYNLKNRKSLVHSITMWKQQNPQFFKVA